VVLTTQLEGALSRQLAATHADQRVQGAAAALSEHVSVRVCVCGGGGVARLLLQLASCVQHVL
jgi:hypothetical protein